MANSEKMTSMRPSYSDGYTLVLPPGWLRLDARTDHGTTELDRELDQVLSTVPRDSYGPLIAEARKQAHTALDQARTAGVLDLYLPLRGRRGTAVPASFVVSIITFSEPPPPEVVTGAPQGTFDDPEVIAARIGAMLAARMPDGQVKQMPAGIAVRSRQRMAATNTSQWPATRIDYHWPLPSQPLKWALASFTTVSAGKSDDDLTELLIGLFDAIMLTWRWKPGLVI